MEGEQLHHHDPGHQHDYEDEEGDAEVDAPGKVRIEGAHAIPESIGAASKFDYQIDHDRNDDRQHDGSRRQQPKKVLVGARAYAAVEPDTMVIEVLDAFKARCAMLARLVNVAHAHVAVEMSRYNSGRRQACRCVDSLISRVFGSRNDGKDPCGSGCYAKQGAPYSSPRCVRVQIEQSVK